MSIYKEWGFSESPFNTMALSADSTGSGLIAGRELEIAKLTRRLHNPPQIPTIEGEFGIGKTSLINVTLFRTQLKFLNERQSNHPLYFRCDKTFQLKSSSNSQDFIEEVLLEVAQTIIANKVTLKNCGIKLPENIEKIDLWINSPSYSSYQGNVGIGIGQIGFGKTTEPNSGSAFENFGIKDIVINWLKFMFPIKNHGGIVCVLDNLELLENSLTARRIIEELRDELFKLHGLRWIFCGSLGIISSIVSSPRMDGLLDDPIELSGITKKQLQELIDKRISTYKNSKSCFLPIRKDEIVKLYEILKFNLRSTLKYANDYCNYIIDNNIEIGDEDDKSFHFYEWLNGKSQKFIRDIGFNDSSNLNIVKLFKDVIDLGGVFSFADFELFGYEKKLKEFKNIIKKLEMNGLLVCVIDENDNRRKSIQVTHKGWFVSYSLKNRI